MRYYIADPHFYHAAMNDQMDCRGFGSMEEMNAYMLDRWNHKVRNNDDVVILGDLSFGNAEQTNDLLAKLKGRLYLIEGNHDGILSSRKVNRERFQWIKPYEELSDQKRKVILCHYPIMCYKGQYLLDRQGNPKVYMLYGHVHDTMDQRLLERFQEETRQTVTLDREGQERKIPCNMINCFCRYSDYEPLTLDEWILCDQKRRERKLL